MQGRNGPSSNRYAIVAIRLDHGFTLIELLVTISVLAILVALAVPSFTSVINNNRLAAQANELVASLQLARTEAVRRNSPVIVCRSTDGTSCTTTSGQGEWLTFVDANGSTTVQAGEILRSAAIKAPVAVSNTVARITFRPDGLARAAAGGGLLSTSITICMVTTQPANNRRVVSIGSGSRISTQPVNGGGTCP